MKRVHEVISCPQIKNGEYDEAKHGGHGAEAVINEHLSKFGFKPQYEVKYREVAGHPDFVRFTDDYIEFVELKNTGSMSYLHILQAAMYKALLTEIYNKSTLGHIWYVKYKVVVGDSPVRPAWVPDNVDYVNLQIDSGRHYLNWALIRTTYKSVIAGPYCIYCKNYDCKIGQLVRKGVPEAKLLAEE